MVVDVPRAMTVPKAATMGVGRFVLLEPNAVKYLLTLEAPTIEDPRSRLRRVTDALVVEGLEVTHAASVLPRLAAAIDDEEDSTITATVIGDRLVDVEPGDTTDRLFGVSIDVGHHHGGRHPDGPARRRRRRGRIHDQPPGTVRRRCAHASEPHADARPRSAGTAPRSHRGHDRRTARQRVRHGGHRARGGAGSGRRRERDDAAPAARRRSRVDRAVAVHRDVPRSPGPARGRRRHRHPPGRPARAVPLDRRVRRRRHRGRHRRDRHRARGRHPAPGRRRHQRGDRRRERGAGGHHRGAGGPRVRGRPDPARHAGDRRRDRRRGLRRRLRRGPTPGDRRRRRAPRHLRVRPDRHRGPAPAQRAADRRGHAALAR